MKPILGWAALLGALGVSASSLGRFKILDDRASLQDIVTWDSKSLFINGERIMIFSGEFHPFRSPVPGLWLDVFQKVKALGMNTVSFYIDWAVLEGKQGDYSADGPLSLEPFFDAAKQAGIYLIARPGPYINAEASGGGFPGWLQRLNATLRTMDKGYLDATDNYIANVGKSIAAAQITNGGPVILYQPENEYTWSANGETVPDGEYMQYVIDQGRKAGVVVPMVSNDAAPNGDDAPGSGVGAVDIYGHDAYYLGPDQCETPSVWPTGLISTNFYQLHEQQSPSTPYSLMEFQAGCWLPWGGTTYDNCAALMNNEWERIFYKNNLGFGVSIMNLYMTAGGTNWGNLGYPQGYTSYDYAAAINEDRTVTRNKYSELKLIANFLKVSPSYLDVMPQNLTIGVYTDAANLTVTPLIGNETASSFYVIRHTDETSQAVTPYKLTVKTSQGNITIPQLGGSLSLHGRDSKIHVTDYPVSNINVLYSSAEILTWKKFADKTVLVVYGGSGEHHELEVRVPGGSASSTYEPRVVEGPQAGVKTKTKSTSVVLSWDVSPRRTIVKVNELEIFLLGRESAYDYWVPELSPSGDGPGFSSWEHTQNSIIVKAGYLVRSAALKGSQLHLTADFNATTDVEVVGAPAKATSLFVNGAKVAHSVDSNGIWQASVGYKKPQLSLPNLESSDWKYVDSLPEIQADYDDSSWPKANLKSTANTYAPLMTPTSLYGADYGFNTGYLLFRAHFVANGKESSVVLHTQGGSAAGMSAWIGKKYLGSWTGRYPDSDHNSTFQVPALDKGKKYVITVLVDQNGFEENGSVGGDDMKAPRGILDYSLAGHDATDVTWKITGNLGGEDYRDRTRGPLNEGGLFAERQGWHQPKPPSSKWTACKITDGIPSAGVRFFTSSFRLAMPKGYDVPLYVTFANTTTPAPAYRAQLFVNGYQLGKYTNHIGPQVAFPVPEGILDYQGENWIAVSVWAQESEGVKVDGIALTAKTPVMTAYGAVKLVEMPAYKKRSGAY